ncbi:MAG: cytochrome P450 [Candidatus Nitrosocosmicus sp.]
MTQKQVEEEESIYPPGPSSLQSLKNVHQLIKDPLKTLTDIAKKYGEISHFKAGRQHIYLINNPQYIEKILIYNHKNFKKGQRLQTAKRLLGEGLVTSEDKKHDNQRKIIQPLFLPKKIIAYGKIMIDQGEALCTEWKDQSIVDIHKEMMKVTLKIICKSVLDYDMESKEAQKFSKEFEVSKKYFKRLQHPIGQVLDHVPILPKVAESREAVKTIDSIVYRLISEKRKSLENNLKPGDDLLTRLLQAQISIQKLKNNVTQESPSTVIKDKSSRLATESTEEDMDDKQIRDNVLTMLLAGHETTSNALTWTYYLVSQYPQIEKKIHEEIDNVISQNKENEKKLIKTPRIEDLSKFKFVEKVIRESLRVYPPVWSIGRIADEDYQIDKYTIPKGASIIMSQYVIHHDDRFYKDPHLFNPERWTDEFKRSNPRFSYFPFGGGIRGCIGESFAWQEAILLMSTISSNFTLNLEPKQKVEMSPGITLNPKKGIKMRVSKR